MVRESAVEFEVQGDDLHRRVTEDRRHGQSAHAVAGVHHDPQGADRGEVDQAAQVGRVLREQVTTGDRARGAAGCGEPFAGRPAFHPGAYLPQAGVLTDRDRSRTAHLDAVVTGGVVAGGDHRARPAQGAAGEVQLVRGAQADFHHVGPLAGGAVCEGPGQRG